MLGTLLITLLIVAICIVLLGVKVFFVKGGKFSIDELEKTLNDSMN